MFLQVKPPYIQLFLLLALGACSLPPSANPPVASPPVVGSNNGGDMVTVMRGDYLSLIAARYRVSMQEIVRLNNLRHPYVLHPGQKLRLPKAAGSSSNNNTIANDSDRPAAYRVRSGDSLDSIGRMYNIAPQELAQLNNIPYEQNRNRPLPIGQLLVLRSQASAQNITPQNNSQSNYNAPNYNGQNYDKSPANSAYLSPDNHGEQPQQTYSWGGGSAVKAPPMIQAQPLAPPTGVHGSAAPLTTVPLAPPRATGPNGQPQALNPSTPIGGVPVPNTALNKPEVKLAPVKTETSPKTESSKTAETEKTANAAKAGKFIWPARGQLLAGFGQQAEGSHNDGLNISAAEGAAVKSAADGEVVYADNKLAGYGNLLLIRHSGGYITAYAHLQDFGVEKGQRVRQGQVIGKAGKTGDAKAPMLHFEIRKGAKPVDPSSYLP
ncbi:MAG: peptidoglycan DD-metalloendopeptidase family protein [Alphaproteobacteria bacterium]